jgi:hypothetical protein
MQHYTYVLTLDITPYKILSSNQINGKLVCIDMTWAPDFCLTCDTQTKGTTYCSLACYLANRQKSSGRTDCTTTSPTSDKELPSSTDSAKRPGPPHSESNVHSRAHVSSESEKALKAYSSSFSRSKAMYSVRGPGSHDQSI